MSHYVRPKIRSLEIDPSMLAMLKSTPYPTPTVYVLNPQYSFRPHVHIDIVGPVPLSDGFLYLLTCIDGFTRWTDAISMRDIHAKPVAYAFLSGWIAHFHVQMLISIQTVDNHCWFFRICTTTFGNGMIERFHYQ